MNPKKKEDWTPEPFPEPRTIPKGWNASALSEEKNKSEPEQDEPEAEWKPDPFPEPRIFPWKSGR